MDSEREIVHYGVCSAFTHMELAGYVNEQIKKGYQPWGSPFTTVQADLLFIHQSMVKYIFKKRSNDTEKIQSDKARG